MENTIILDRKARIALDTLQFEERQGILKTINILKDFPKISDSIYKQLKKQNYFVARAGDYRIIFNYQELRIIIVDIVNRKAIDNLFSTL